MVALPTVRLQEGTGAALKTSPHRWASRLRGCRRCWRRLLLKHRLRLLLRGWRRLLLHSWLHRRCSRQRRLNFARRLLHLLRWDLVRWLADLLLDSSRRSGASWCRLILRLRDWLSLCRRIRLQHGHIVDRRPVLLVSLLGHNVATLQILFTRVAQLLLLLHRVRILLFVGGVLLLSHLGHSLRNRRRCGCGGR